MGGTANPHGSVNHRRAELLVAKPSKPNQSVSLVYTPLNDAQRELADKWAESKLVILVGEAGTGKTTAGFSLAIQDLLAKRIDKIILCRPTVTVDEDIGFFPGDMNAKLLPWAASFADSLEGVSNQTLTDLAHSIELVPVGMLRGRTVRRAVLICDEAANLTRGQLKVICTRVGKGGKVVLCGDPDQTDLPARPNPLADAAKRVSKDHEAAVIQFTARDQVRDPFVSRILKLLG